MANDLTNNPLVIDTPAATAVISSYISITGIRLVDSANDIADGDQAIVHNGASKVVWEHRTTTPGMIGGDMQTSFNPPLVQKGLIVPTLTHGKLYIYWTGKQPTA